MTTGKRTVLISAGAAVLFLTLAHGSEAQEPSNSDQGEIQTVLDLIERGRLDVSQSVQREVPLHDAASIFSEPGGPARTVILPKGEELTR